MRWLILLLMAPLGAASKEAEIPCTTWYEGHLTSCDVVIIGEIVSVASHVEQSPSQILPTESCIIRIDEVVGSNPELRGATTAKLTAHYIHDTYRQLEPDWGVYRHLHAGHKVVAFIHRYEKDLAIGSGALIVLKPETLSLPAIIKRTAFDLALFTDDDLAVWKAAWPRMFPELADRVAYERELREEERRLGKVTPLEWLMLTGSAAAILAAGIGVCFWLRRFLVIKRSIR